MRKLTASATALVLIDLQKGILARPTQPHSTSAVVAAGARLAARFRDLRAPVVIVTVDWHHGFVDALAQPVEQPMPRAADGPAPDFAEVDSGLGAVSDDLRITKRQWGAFHGTELDLQLRRHGIDTIVIGGVATNMGVESTARAAWEHGYAVVFAEDATTTFTDEMHQFAFTNIFPRIGCIGSVDEILAAIN